MNPITSWFPVSDEPFARSPGARLRKRHADEKRPDETRALRYCERVQVAPVTRRLVECALYDTADIAHMLARREFGDYATPLAMNLDLGCDDARAKAPGARRIVGGFDDRSGRLVARSFDAQNAHLLTITGARVGSQVRRYAGAKAG